jgi:DNA-binding MarR family transcriptional regulator
MVSLAYHFSMASPPDLRTTGAPAQEPAAALRPEAGAPEHWRQTHLGRLLGHALRRFDARVLQLMAHNVEVPLALSNLAARDQVSAAHVHITRHLSLRGDRLTDLAERAGMSKQSMGHLVDQCAAWGLVMRTADPHDTRARRICFTATGLAWLQAFREAVAQAEAEFRAEVGPDVATVVALGLEAYAAAALPA